MARTTKHKLAEQAQRIIKSGNITDDNEISSQELILYVSQSFAEQVRLRFFEGKAEGEEYVNGVYIYAFEDVQIKKDFNKNLLYSDIPSSYVDLPKNVGVHQISLMQGQRDAFIPSDNNHLSLFSGITDVLQGKIGYFIESGRAYYVDDNNELDTDCKILIKLVASIADIDEDTEIDIPDDMQSTIIKSAIELYMLSTQTIKDLSSDNIE